MAVSRQTRHRRHGLAVWLQLAAQPRPHRSGYTARSLKAASGWRSSSSVCGPRPARAGTRPTSLKTLNSTFDPVPCSVIGYQQVTQPIAAALSGALSTSRLYSFIHPLRSMERPSIVVLHTLLSIYDIFVPRSFDNH